MKSILQSIALVSAILFIVSCDSGGNSGVTSVPITPPQPPADPEFGIDGRAVKGVIGGGTITVVDSAGADRMLSIRPSPIPSILPYQDPLR